MFESKIANIFFITAISSYYFGFVIRLLRSGRKRVFMPALQFSFGMLFSPLLFPYFLYLLKRNKIMEDLIRTAFDEVIGNQSIPKEVYNGMLSTLLIKLSSPSFFLKCLGQLLIDYLENWDKHIDSLVNTVPKRESPRLSFITTLIDYINRQISNNKIFYIGNPTQ
jgi:hypothetical protein